MAREVEIETRILGGLPVRVYGRVHPAERDIGWGGGGEIDDIQWLPGRSLPDAMWKRISDKEISRIEEELKECGE